MPKVNFKTRQGSGPRSNIAEVGTLQVCLLFPHKRRQAPLLGATFCVLRWLSFGLAWHGKAGERASEGEGENLLQK